MFFIYSFSSLFSKFSTTFRLVFLEAALKSQVYNTSSSLVGLSQQDFFFLIWSPYVGGPSSIHRPLILFTHLSSSLFPLFFSPLGFPVPLFYIPLIPITLSFLSRQFLRPLSALLDPFSILPDHCRLPSPPFLYPSHPHHSFFSPKTVSQTSFGFI